MWEAEQAVVRLVKGAGLHDVLDAADPAAWTGLDEAVRSTAWQLRDALPSLSEIEGRPWRRMPGRARPARLGTSRLALALCHPDGRVRGAALEPAVAVAELLPLVAVRCTDWAEPVRSRARDLLRQVMPGLGPSGLAAVGPLLTRLGQRQRGDFGDELLREALQRLSDDRLRGLLDVSDRALRRLVWRSALQRGMFSAVELAGAAARGHDVVVRRLCADAVLTQVGPRTGDDVLAPLLTTRSADTRAAGVTALRRAGRAAQAEPFLADRSATVRACARYVLRQAGMDPLPRYRSRCADPHDVSMPPGAPVGLAECGAREDAGLLGHPVAAVRAQAVAGLRLLEAVDAERLRPLLADPAPAVARETVKALMPDSRRLPADWLTGLLAPDRPAHTRHAAFRLLDARGGLDQLRAAAALLDDPDPRLRFRAEQSARRWQRPVRLTDGGAAALAPLLARCAQLRRSRY
jgi:hypothetical protein